MSDPRRLTPPDARKVLDGTAPVGPCRADRDAIAFLRNRLATASAAPRSAA